MSDSNQPEQAENRQSILRIAVPVGFFVALLFILFYYSLSRDKFISPSQRQNKPLPEFTSAVLFSDQVVNSKDIRGDYWLLNVWGSWCVSCYAEHGFLMSLEQQGFKIIGVNYRDTESKAAEFLRSRGDPYEFSFFDPRGMIAIEMGVTAAPETFLISPTGEVLAHRIGVMDEKVWQQLFAPQISSQAEAL